LEATQFFVNNQVNLKRSFEIPNLNLSIDFESV